MLTALRIRKKRGVLSDSEKPRMFGVLSDSEKPNSEGVSRLCRDSRSTKAYI